MATILLSSIGKKFIQAISGAFLILFLLLHSVINFFSVIDSFTGTFGAVGEGAFSADSGLFQLGCDFMSTAIITIMVPILALGFIIHIAYGCWLTWSNIQSRGGWKRYEVSGKGKADSWSAKNMFVLGIVVLGFLFYHLFHFWANMQLQEFIGAEAENPYVLLTHTFGHWWVTLLYIVWFVAIWYHLTHGFWSMFQTVGWNNQTWFKRVKVIGDIVATIIVLLFVAVAVNGFLQANGLIGGCCCG